MKSINSLACVALFAAVGYAAGNCSKVDIPVGVTISSGYADPMTGVNYTSAIQPDQGGEYVNGVNNVIATIHVCNGSYAVTLNPNGGSRTITYDFTHSVSKNAETPTWTSTPVTTSNTFISFSNLMYDYNAGSTYAFTTYMNELYLPKVAGGPYYGAMENPLAEAPTSAPVSAVNTPCETSLVNVVHNPATSMSSETWVLWSDGSQPQNCNGNTFLQVGSLYVTAKHGDQNVGQFSLPFSITIRRLP